IATPRRHVAIIIGLAVATLAPMRARADRDIADHDIAVPDVPANLEVPAGNHAYLRGEAGGAQNYICLPTATGGPGALFGPQAALFDQDKREIATHFLSANPDENGTPRPTWQHSRDTSANWGLAIASSTAPAFVETGAIPWLLLRVVGAEAGPSGGTRLVA